jgi:hypothetical protein
VPVQQDGQLAHPGQAELGHGHAGITGKSGIAVIAGDIGVADNSEIANGDKEEKEVNEEKEEEKKEEKEEQHGEKANTGVAGVIANMGWQGGRIPRVRKKINKF